MIKRRSWILAILTALNLLNYVDRYILSAVLPKVQESLGVADWAAGALGTVFMLGYCATSPIFARLARRGIRRQLLALGVAVWSAATCLTATATALPVLLGYRAFVGVGEASYATLAPTMIDDAAPEGRKGKWLALFYIATPLGSALGYVLGGFIEKAFGWRPAFVVAGAPGVALAALCLLLQDPSPPASTSTTPEPPSRTLVSLLRDLAIDARFRFTLLGYCALTFALGGFAFWAPTFLYRQFSLQLSTANYFIGLITVVAGITGTLVGGAWGDAIGRRGGGEPRVEDYLVVCAAGASAGTMLAVSSLLAPTANLFFLQFFLCEVALFLPTSCINAALLLSVPRGDRASVMAISIFAIHVLGDVWSPTIVGVLTRAYSMRTAMLSLTVATAIGSVWWWLGQRREGPRYG